MLYRNSLKLAAKHLKAEVPTAEPKDIVAAAATVFIAVSRDGVKSAEPPKPPPPPEPEPVTAPDDYPEDDDLPF